MKRTVLPLSIAIATGVTLLSANVSAESWCAEPLWVHEWGVQIFDGSGAALPPSTAAPAQLTPTEEMTMWKPALVALASLCATTSSATAASWCAEPLWVHEWGVQLFDAEGDAQPPSVSPPTSPEEEMTMWKPTLVTVAALCAMTSSASARSWCAQPLWVHEWGVQLFDGEGTSAGPPPLPEYFHTTGPTSVTAHEMVRDMPADSGIRTLPVVHFYTSGSWANDVPVAIDVGFTEGAAAAWYPQVDVLRPAEDANSASAAVNRALLDGLRVSRPPVFRVPPTATPMPADPTAQLSWESLVLTPAPRHDARSAGSVDWVDDLRGLDAMWVNNHSESERFLFYEADTSERALIELSRGETWASDRGHYLASNLSEYDVHDVFIVNREGDQVSVFFAPRIPAGSSAGFLFEDHQLEPDEVGAGTREALKARLVDRANPDMPTDYSWFEGGECVMMRDPAVPETAASGHQLYSAEVEAILDVWSEAFFEQDGTTILYREDIAYLDAMMPLSVYTDMFHYPVTQRLGLGLVQNVVLP